MNIAFFFGEMVIIVLMNILVWIKYNVFSTEMLKERRGKILLITYILITAGECILVGFKEYNWMTLIKICLAYLLISGIALIDYKFHIIPNKLLFYAILLRLFILIIEYYYNSDQFMEVVLECIGGTLIGFGILFLTHLLSKGGIGMGDVKLFGVIGFIIGLRGTYNTLFYSLIFLVLYSCIGMMKKELTRKSMIPFGPFVYLGYLITFGMGAF